MQDYQEIFDQMNKRAESVGLKLERGNFGMIYVTTLTSTIRLTLVNIEAVENFINGWNYRRMFEL